MKHNGFSSIGSGPSASHPDAQDTTSNTIRQKTLKRSQEYRQNKHPEPLIVHLWKKTPTKVVLLLRKDSLVQ